MLCFRMSHSPAMNIKVAKAADNAQYLQNAWMRNACMPSNMIDITKPTTVIPNSAVSSLRDGVLVYAWIAMKSANR